MDRPVPGVLCKNIVGVDRLVCAVKGADAQVDDADAAGAAVVSGLGHIARQRDRAGALDAHARQRRRCGSGRRQCLRAGYR